MLNQFEELKKCPNPNCSSSELVFLFKANDYLSGQGGEFYLAKCSKCGLVFQNPRVKQEFIGQYYTQKLGYYNPKQATKKQDIKAKIKYFFKKQTLINHFNYPLAKKSFLFFCLSLPFKRWLKVAGIPQFKTNGLALDIGCSHGEFLEELKNLGWLVFGIEMDEKVANYAKNERGLEVVNKRIDDFDFENKKFDVITMRMVLEHLYNPFEILNKIGQQQKPKAELIFSVPYFWGIEFMIFKKYTYALQLPHHTFFFKKSIIKKYLKKLGYYKIKFYHYYGTKEFTSSSQIKYQETNKKIYKFLAYNKLARIFLTAFIFFMSLLSFTGRVTVYAQKND